MKGRLIAIVAALAVLAFAGICYERASASQPKSQASHLLADSPAPDQVPAAIIAEAVSTSATVRTVFVVESRHPLGPAVAALPVGRPLSVVAHRTARPRSFPLLI